MLIGIRSAAKRQPSTGSCFVDLRGGMMPTRVLFFGLAEESTYIAARIAELLEQAFPGSIRGNRWFRVLRTVLQSRQRSGGQLELQVAEKPANRKGDTATCLRVAGEMIRDKVLYRLLSWVVLRHGIRCAADCAMLRVAKYVKSMS